MLARQLGVCAPEFFINTSDFAPTSRARSRRAASSIGANWHTHPLGQTLIVTAGCGCVQSWGGPIKVIRPGDVICCSPGEKHWHGAMPGTAMTHLAIQEELNGRVVDWMETVSDEQYAGRREDQ